jgi:iron complex outermembrane recepter protein
MAGISDLTSMTRVFLPGLVLLLVLLRSSAYAQAHCTDLVTQSLEDLMRVEITSVGRKQQAAGDVAAAVHVITQDDIRRSGIRSLPELFRLVPGMQVAAVNSNNLAVSVRGFNDVFANKVLVLVDGRSIYTRTFSGVLWHAEDMMLEDIERIEIVRGPGGASWGANAVNGVINIITKSAGDTQGTAVRAGTGTHNPSEGAVRYGGTVGRLDYRVFGLWADHGAGSRPDREAGDTWNSVTTGFRADWERDRHAVMFQGSIVDGRQHPLWLTHSVLGSTVDMGQSTSRNSHLLGRWTFSLAPDTSLQVQSFYSRQRWNEALLRNLESEADVDVEFHANRGRHDLVAGGGYRGATHTDDGGSYSVSFPGADHGYHTVNVFLQDEIRIGRRLRATAGAKVEHDIETGTNFQPTSRLIWDLVPQQHLWAAVSRAVRRPSLIDLHLLANMAPVPGPQGLRIVPRVFGNADYESEKFLTTEVGYRATAGSKVSLDVTAFRGRYTGLSTQERGTPTFEATPAPAHLVMPVHRLNLLGAVTTGGEVSVRVMPFAAWRIDGSYAGFHVTPHLDARSTDLEALKFDANAPTHQWQLHSSVSLGARMEIDAHVYHVGRLRRLAVPAYTRADARVEVKLKSGLSVVGTGQNLFNRTHVEFSSAVMDQSLVRRNVHAGFAWRF